MLRATAIWSASHKGADLHVPQISGTAVLQHDERHLRLPTAIETGKIQILRDHLIKAIPDGLGAAALEAVGPFNPVRGTCAGHDSGHQYHEHAHDHHHDDHSHGHHHD